METRPFSIVILISGNGSNLQAIIDQVQTHKLELNIACVISNKANAFGLVRAQNAGLKNLIINHQDFASREAYDHALAKAINLHAPELIVLAGFMRILSADFVNTYIGKLINIHPSLLPKYQGLNTHQRVLDAGDRIHGASVHFVTPELDAGPVILQGTTDVKPDDTAASLAQRVHLIEHKIYPIAIDWVMSQRLRMNDAYQLFLNNIPLNEPKLITLNGC